MNRNLKNFLIGFGSVIDLFPVSPRFDRKSLTERIKLRVPSRPMTTAEAAEFNANAIRGDWQHVGDALRKAAAEVHDRTAQ
ncbi:MAG: hypothetical protein HQM04_18545 [Magnetococcales bacterium]|nr:hypothetical protein [Magnetococcales bacterium]